MRIQILLTLIAISNSEMMANIDKLDAELHKEAIEESNVTEKPSSFVDTWLKFQTEEDLEDEVWLEESENEQ